MLLSKTTIVKWNSRNKSHYLSKGYKFTKMGDEFEVNIDDLTNGTNVSVDVKCDYCHKHYEKRWNRYLMENEKSNIHKDACDNCKHIKVKESVQLTYGCDNVFQLDDVKEKIVNTNIVKYGVENPFQSEKIKKKIIETNYNKYGCASYMQTQECKDKRREYCLENFGIPYMPQLNITHQKGKLSPHWIGGADVHGFYRITNEYKEWHDFVLERDNYICQCCGDTNGFGHTVKFHVHHIHNFADNKDLIYDKDNGICLCNNCHRKFHSIYGYRNTNNFQLEEFILNHGKNVC